MMEEKRCGGEMPHMSLAEICEAVGGRFIGRREDLDKRVTLVSMDSRRMCPGALFIAVKGERADGHDFLEDVFAAGALAAVCEKETGCGGNVILVENSIRALQEMAAYYRSHLDTKTVLVTGSVGKTSTKEMCGAVLSEKYRVLKTEGNYNNEIGLPLTVLRLRPEHEVAVLEAGIDEPGEMDIIARAAQPDICIITNIGICHMENLGSRQGIFEEKSKCLEYMRPGGTALFFGGDDILSAQKGRDGQSLMFFGTEPENGHTSNPVYVKDAEDLGYEGSRARLVTPLGETDIEITIPGKAMLINAAAAAAAGVCLGLSNREIAAGIKKARTISGRTNLIRRGDVLIVDDCYNASPVSVKAALELLTKAPGRKVAVLGDMGELGPEEAQLHREVGEFAGRCGIDALFLSGELSDNTRLGASGSGVDVRYFADKSALKTALAEYIRPGDTVLVKASHFMNYTEIVEFLQQG